uniref:Homeodomain-like protein n=1 Tax=Tanacetum cinerariifolium TaxID=118510 RepID=A0A699J308_TANCI|nr:homeodomain-like protein [Tanacetum cinerariifolium]
MQKQNGQGCENKRKRRHWKNWEDIRLREFVACRGTRDWRLISEQLPGRSVSSCKLRWLNHLDPNVKKTDFTIEENNVLIRTHEIYGNKWTRIAEFLPGRSDSMIMNQWQVLTSLRSKNINAGVSSSSAYNRRVSVDSANNSSGSTITLFGKSIVINEDTSLPCMNKPPSPSGVTSAYHGDCIAGTSTVMPSTVVALPAQPKSKAGKRFGFVRFIKVFDVERLVNNLCTVWIGRHRIHANVARFQRTSLNNSSNKFIYKGGKRNNINDVRKDKGAIDTSNSYAHVVKGGSPVNGEVDNNPALVLDESCLNLQDYSRCLMEEVKKKFQSNVGTGTWFSQLQQASTDFITDRRVTWVELEGKAYWVRAKEVSGWVPDFVEQDNEESDSDDEHSEGELNGDILRSIKDLEGDNEKDVIPETVFEDNLPKSHDGEASVGQNEVLSEDPFNSKKRNGSVREVGEKANRSDDMKSDSERIISKEESTESVCSGHFKKSETPRSCGSILSLMD